MDTLLILDLRECVSKHRADPSAMVRVAYASINAQFRRTSPMYVAAVLPDTAPGALEELMRAMGIPSWRVQDDRGAGGLMAALKQAGLANHCKVVVASHSTAALQLLGRRTEVIDMTRDDMVDADYLESRFGLRPDQVPSFLALTEASERAGVHAGASTIIRLLNAHGAVETLLLSGAVRHPDSAWLAGQSDFLARRVSEHTYFPAEITLERITDLAKSAENDVSLQALSRQHQIPLVSDGPNGASRSLMESVWVRRPEEVGAIMRKDVRGITLDVWADPQGAASAVLIRTRCGVSYAVDLAASDDRQSLVDALRPIVEDPAVFKGAWAAKPVIRALLREGLVLRGLVVDGLVISSMTEPDGKFEDLERAGAHFLSKQVPRLVGATIGSNPQSNLAAVAERLTIARDLCGRSYESLGHDPALRTVWRDFELPLIPVLAKMEARGMAVDRSVLHGLAGKLRNVQIDLNKKILATPGAWHGFDPGNTGDVAKLLYTVLKLPVPSRTPKGHPSTDEDALKMLVEAHPVARLIIQYRKASHALRSTIEPLLARIADSPGATPTVHASINQHRVRTGRLSTSDPNLHGTPSKGRLGDAIREAFIAERRRVLVVGDLSQIELRILAQLSRDERLCEAFANGLDIHKATAAEVFGKPLGMVSDEMRRAAKAINFGLIYGLSAHGLASSLGISKEDAETYMQTYFRRYPRVQAFLQETIQFARERGYVETLAGRQIMIPGIGSDDWRTRSRAERQAMNAPMQGSAAELVKRSMLDFERAVVEQGLDGCLHMQVHDELVASAPRDQGRAVAQLMTHCLEHPQGFSLSVPLVAETGVGQNWLTAKKCLEEVEHELSHAM